MQQTSRPSPPTISKPIWMPFTANRQFKKKPRLLVARRGHALLEPRRPAGARRHVGPVVRERRPRAGRRSPTRCTSSSWSSTTRPAFQMGHPKVFELAARAGGDLTPQGLDHVFFTNSGLGVGRDGAEDRARLSPREGRGQPHPPDRPRARLSRRQFRRHLGRRHGRQPKAVRHAARRRRPSSATPTTSPRNAFSRGQPEHGAELADELERLVALHDASTIAAVIVEPVAGSTGVLIPPKGYLERLRAICDKHGILLIFDEVITGFGRLGAPFARGLFRRDARHHDHRQGRSPTASSRWARCS